MKWKYEHFETVASTNDMARSYPPFTIVTADLQTNGRGRYGRMWESVSGNLFFSAVLPAASTLTPFAVGLAVAGALAPFPVRIKWPNDVLLNGHKVAGILFERADNGLIVGVGVNLAVAPENAQYPAGHLNGALSKQTVVERLAANLLEYEQMDFKMVRAQWLKKAVGLGHPLTARLADRTVTGIFTDLSQTGALILQQSDHTLCEIVAGDIFFEKETK